jgi:heterodisulfide reductase subunit D
MRINSEEAMTQSNYNVAEIMQLDACTNCRLCADVCPAVCASQDGELSGVYRLHQMRRVLRSRAGLLRRLFGKKPLTDEELKSFSQTVYRCTLCGRCQHVCPSGIMLRELWFSLRQDLVHYRAYPKKVDMILENVTASHNVFDEENEERAEWVEDMRDAPEDGLVREKADVVYFTGCVAAYFPLARQIPMALAGVFNRAGVNYTLLGEEEWCCGFPLLGAGLGDYLEDLMAHNIEAVKSKGAGTIVFACPSCYQMWREHYVHDFEIYHATQYIQQLVENNRLNLNALDLTVTYHDPCDLGRGSGEYLAPREVIRSIPGVRLVEMADNRENCLCCGGGGNLEMIDSQLSAEIAQAKIDQVQATGAQAVVTGCQQCVRAMTTYVRRNKIKLDVLDVVQLVERSLES